jgi:hypothetical protein
MALTGGVGTSGLIDLDELRVLRGNNEDILNAFDFRGNESIAFRTEAG